MSPAASSEVAEWATSLIHSRCNVSPRRLVEPGPDAAQLTSIFEAASAAPDHGQLRPWRFVVVGSEKRALLANVFEAALLERDPAATETQRQSASEKAHRAPVLVLAIACLDGGEPRPLQVASGTGTRVHDHERIVALGCAIQNVLLMAQAHGFGAGLTSGQAMQSQALRLLFGLLPHEHAVCCINLGTVSHHKSRGPRPGIGNALSYL